MWRSGRRRRLRPADAQLGRSVSVIRLIRRQPGQRRLAPAFDFDDAVASSRHGAGPHLGQIVTEDRTVSVARTISAGEINLSPAWRAKAALLQWQWDRPAVWETADRSGSGRRAAEARTYEDREVDPSRRVRIKSPHGRYRRAQYVESHFAK